MSVIVALLRLNTVTQHRSASQKIKHYYAQNFDNIKKLSH
tara:strand:+ start:649 stop:768 length:120 start_codon:yes stop_codon:yes gene_type:complete